MAEAESGTNQPQETPGEKKSGKKKSPHQKRAEAQADRESWTQEAIDAAILANGGTPKTQETTKHPGGRPSKYPTIDLERVEMYAAGGLTKIEIADRFGITYTTLREYEIQFPEFLAAIEKGRRRDIGQVEDALHKVAKGYTFPEEKLQYDNQVGKWARETTLKHVPPDTKAALAILLHAETKSWKPKSEVDHSFPEPLVIKSLQTGQAIEALGADKPPAG